LASPEIRFPIFRKSFESIFYATGLDYSEFQHVVFVDWKKIPKTAEMYLKWFCGIHKNISVFDHRGTWANDINWSFQKAWLDDFKWVACFHDDVYNDTDDWFVKLEAAYEDKPNVGVITSTDIIYRKTASSYPVARPGYYKDVYENSWDVGNIFQFNKFRVDWRYGKIFDEWNETLENYLDYPSGPVKTFSSWSCVMVLRSELARKLHAENWVHWTLLNELDLNMQTMMLGYYNSWFPKWETEHHRDDPSHPVTRSNSLIKDYKDVAHKAFENKWGFSHLAKKEEVDRIRKLTEGTLLREFIGEKYTYDWDYL
jgi:hypothetical protein